MSYSVVLKYTQQLKSVLAPFGVFTLFSLLLFSASRLLLIIWLYPRVMSTDGILFIILNGLRFDFVLLGIVLAIPLMLSPLMSINTILYRLWKPLLLSYLLIAFSLFIFIEAATPSFINQYNLRPNIWFIEYLKYPDEVFSTLYKAYKLPLLFAIIITLFTSTLLFNQLKEATLKKPDINWFTALLSVPLIFIICVIAIRSTLDHRPVNPGTVAFSNDPLINTLALPSAYSVLYAAYQMKNEQKNLRPYGSMPSENVINIIKQNMHLQDNQFLNSHLPTLHRNTPQNIHTKPKNLVIILMESMGAEFIGCMGGPPLTPNLDSLSQQGIWFKNLYATGTRSVRGIEAVISGFLPTTARSVVKLPKSQNNFFTLASTLKSKGYSTSFIYGGEGQFDNMAAFFSGNGFEKIIDQDSYIDPVFYGSWGVPDEDLFTRADQEFTQQHSKGPFFSLVFTASNHSPYDFPDGRIKLYEHPKETKNNSAKYTDYAIGEFFKQAKNSTYWDDTVFLVIADHNSRVYGSNLVPVQGFHIPALILGKDIKPKLVTRVASQIDMLPTLLSLIGVQANIPTTGIDLTRPDINAIPGRAIMQYANNFAYMEKDNVLILTPGKKPKHFKYHDKKLQPIKSSNRAFERKALAHAIWPTIAYQKQLYHALN